MFKKYRDKIPKNSVSPIAFFVSWYRATNETFVSNELYSFQRSGVSGSIYYERLNKRNIQPVNLRINYPSHFIFSYPFRNFRGHKREKLLSHLSILFANPIGYMRAVIFFQKMPIPKDRDLFVLMGLLAARLRLSKTKLIYIHDGKWISFIGILCSYLAGIPCGIIFHTEYIFARPEDLFQKLVHANFTIFQSQYSRSYVIAKIGVNRDVQKRMHVISSPGVNVDFFKPLEKRKHHKGLRILSIGRLEEMKGFDSLVHAIKVLRSECIDASCTIVGYGSREEHLKKLIRSLRLKQYVSLAGFMGHSKKLLQLMSDADMFVLPSVVDKKGDRDMQPNAVKEAMAMELLVLTSNLGGIEEVINDGVNGFLLPSSDPKVIAAVIKRVWRLPDRERKIIQKRARDTIIKHHGSSLIIGQLNRLFRHEVAM